MSEQSRPRRFRRNPVIMNPLDALAEKRICEAQRGKLLGKLGILLTRAGALRSTRAADDEYYRKIAEKLSTRKNL